MNTKDDKQLLQHPRTHLDPYELTEEAGLKISYRNQLLQQAITHLDPSGIFQYELTDDQGLKISCGGHRESRLSEMVAMHGRIYAEYMTLLDAALDSNRIESHELSRQKSRARVRNITTRIFK